MTQCREIETGFPGEIFVPGIRKMNRHRTYTERRVVDRNTILVILYKIIFKIFRENLVVHPVVSIQHN